MWSMCWCWRIGRQPLLVTIYNITMTLLSAGLAMNELVANFGCFAFYSMILSCIVMALLTLVMRVAILLFQYAITAAILHLEHRLSRHDRALVGGRITSTMGTPGTPYIGSLMASSTINNNNNNTPTGATAATTTVVVRRGTTTLTTEHSANDRDGNIRRRSSSGSGMASSNWYVRHRHWLKSSFLAHVVMAALLILLLLLAATASPWDSSVACAPWFRLTMLTIICTVVFVFGVILFALACLLRQHRGEDGHFIKSGNHYHPYHCHII
jgi:uncharacterized membrane protein